MGGSVRVETLPPLCLPVLAIRARAVPVQAARESRFGPCPVRVFDPTETQTAGLPGWLGDLRSTFRLGRPLTGCSAKTFAEPQH